MVWNGLRPEKAAAWACSFEALEARQLMSGSGAGESEIAALREETGIGTGIEMPLAKKAANAAVNASQSATRAKPKGVRKAKTLDFFPIGVWHQPIRSFDEWKQRGINTLVGYEKQSETVSLEQWNAEAQKRGFYMVRQPREKMREDVKEKRLLAWLWTDEPDLKGIKPRKLEKVYAKWKKADPNRPVFVNYSGGAVLGWQGNPGEKVYRRFMKSTDWVGSDIYPVTGWNKPGELDAPGEVVERLSDWSGGKPQWAFIETGDQELWWLPSDAPGPTADQMRAQIWHSIIAGAKGIVYFTMQIGQPFEFDNTPWNVIQEMTRQNWRLGKLGAALQQPLNPKGAGLNLSGSMVGSWRKHEGKTYYIVMNDSNKQVTAKIGLVGAEKKGKAWVAGEGKNLPGREVKLSGGAVTEKFKAYEARVYVVEG